MMNKTSLTEKIPSRLMVYGPLLAVILTAFFLRVWRLPELPPGLWYDEAYNLLDARWMLTTGNYQPFLVGNNGREAMVHFLLLLMSAGIGHPVFAARLVGSMAGVLAVPIMYRLALALAGPFVQHPAHRRWLALVAAGWLAVSWWHLHNSRSGLRPVLLPPVLMLSLYFYWRGYAALKNGLPTDAAGLLAQWRRWLPALGWAGLFLGLAQYTYLSARLAPLIFALLALLWSISLWRFRSRLIDFWLGALLAALVSAVVFAPLGLFFLNNPTAFSARTDDVIFIPKTMAQTVAHLLNAISLFLGASHDLYRHHLPGRAMLGWLEIPLFWLGLGYLLHPARLKRAQTHLLLVSFGIMWLPSLLALPPVHSLRPIGLQPFYIIIVAIGTYQLARLARWPVRHKLAFGAPLVGVTALVLLGLTGAINFYDYFWRWGNHPEVYKEYNGPLADLTGQIIELTRTRDVMIPFYVYVHPTTRALLGSDFTEVTAGPPPALTRPASVLLTPEKFQLLYVANIPDSAAMALLTRDEAGRGRVYVSRLPRDGEQAQIDARLAAATPQATPFTDRLGRNLAQFVPFSAPLPTELAVLFNAAAPRRAIDLNWGNQAQLTGYDVSPEVASPGSAITINFYWRSLTDNTFDQRLFLQIVDAAGQPVTQWEGDAFVEDMYRWRPGGLLSSQHTLWLGPDAPPGPYLIRLGFFDRHTGARLPLQPSGSLPDATGVDQAYVGLFYVAPAGVDPRRPATPLQVVFGDSIRLTGVTLPAAIRNPQPVAVGATLPITFYWQAVQPVAKPYTVFLQLLNEKGQMVSGWDSQPLAGRYPTSFWSPGEVVVDTFALPLPPPGLPPGAYRLITGFYQVDTGQRLPANSGGDFAQLATFTVK